MVTSIMVFYGLATALTAVNVWETYVRVEEITKQEASTLAVLYRNVSEYPEPIRGVLRDEIRAYTEQIIHQAWPQQRRGRIPAEGVKSMDQLQSTIENFEPATEAQKVLALETLSSFDRMMEARRLRLDSVERKLPGVIWLVVLLGAFLSLFSTYFFPVLDVRVHRAQIGLLAAFIGLVIFMIWRSTARIAATRPEADALRDRPRALDDALNPAGAPPFIGPRRNSSGKNRRSSHQGSWRTRRGGCSLQCRSTARSGGTP
jgi:hypothetical protein